MIDSLATWVSTFEALVPIPTPQWAQQFADWVDARVTNKITLNGVYNTSGNPLIFVFNKTTFKNELEQLTPTSNKILAIQRFANAWQTAVLASQVQTLAGSYIDMPDPSTTWSLVTSTIFNSSGISAGYDIIMELVNAPNTTQGNSWFPEKFRNAFLALTIDTQGFNSEDPPSPLNDYNRGVL